MPPLASVVNHLFSEVSGERPPAEQPTMDVHIFDIPDAVLFAAQAAAAAALTLCTRRGALPGMAVAVAAAVDAGAETADRGEGYEGEEAHFGVALVGNRVDWAKSVPPVPGSLLDLVSASGALLVNSSGAGDCDAAQLLTTASVRTSVGFAPTGAGTVGIGRRGDNSGQHMPDSAAAAQRYSSALTESDCFGRPLFFAALGDAGSGPDGGGTCTLRIAPGPTRETGMEVSLAPGKVLRLGGSAAGAPLTYTVSAATGSRCRWVVLRPCEALGPIKALVESTTPLSKNQLKRQIRAVLSQAATAAIGGLGVCVGWSGQRVPRLARACARTSGW